MREQRGGDKQRGYKRKRACPSILNAKRVAAHEKKSELRRSCRLITTGTPRRRGRNSSNVGVTARDQRQKDRELRVPASPRAVTSPVPMALAAPRVRILASNSTTNDPIFCGEGLLARARRREPSK